MKRLAYENINTAQEYDRIYQIRKEKGVDEQDVRRWELMLRYFRGGKLVDLGCLDSGIPIMAKNKYPKSEVWGLDIASEAIKDLQEKYPQVIYKVEDITNTHLPRSYFDYVVVGEVMEHLEEPFLFLVEAFRILKKGGYLVVSVPKDETHLGEVDGDRHLWSYSPDDIRGLLEIYGDTTIRILRSQYFPTYRYCFPTIIGYCKKQ